MQQVYIISRYAHMHACSVMHARLQCFNNVG